MNKPRPPTRVKKLSAQVFVTSLMVLFSVAGQTNEQTDKYLFTSFCSKCYLFRWNMMVFVTLSFLWWIYLPVNVIVSGCSEKQLRAERPPGGENNLALILLLSSPSQLCGQYQLESKLPGHLIWWCGQFVYFVYLNIFSQVRPPLVWLAATLQPCCSSHRAAWASTPGWVDRSTDLLFWISNYQQTNTKDRAAWVSALGWDSHQDKDQWSTPIHLVSHSHWSH